MANHPLGKSVPRKEGRKKVTGQALYVDDLTFPDMLHGVTIPAVLLPVGRSGIFLSEEIFPGMKLLSLRRKTFQEQITLPSFLTTNRILPLNKLITRKSRSSFSLTWTSTYSKKLVAM